MILFVVLAVLLIFGLFLTTRSRRHRQQKERERVLRSIESSRQQRIERELREIGRKLEERNLLMSVTDPGRGTPSERALIMRLLRCGVPSGAIFHDLYVSKFDGRFSQVDLVVATRAGIVVFEVKDYGGWIFGNGRQQRWTQVLAYGRERYRFYNPVLQNARHIAVLKDRLPQFRNIPFFSVIVFDGDCELRDVSFVPDGTFIVKPGRVVEVMNLIVGGGAPAAYTDKREVAETLRRAVRNGSDPEVRSRHAAHVKDMLGTERVFD